MKYNLPVFDGTLSDSEVSIMEALQFAAKDLGISKINRVGARRGIGLPLRRTIEVAAEEAVKHA